MFFTISKQPDHRLPCHHTIGDFYFSHDAGWHLQNGSWYKGYYYDQIAHGNFARINLKDDKISLEHDGCRSFPLWWDKSTMTLTNLLGDHDPVWADQSILIDSSGIHLEKKSIYPLISKNKTTDDVIDSICNNLVSKIDCLKASSSNLPIKLFLTGGIDTLVLYSLFKYTGTEFEVIDYEYVKYDQFLNKNLESIRKKHWAYRQIHHWPDPTFLISGSCGDEFTFRGPAAISFWAAWKGINVYDIINKRSGYHCGYFSKPVNLEIFSHDWKNQHQIRDAFPAESLMLNQILNITANDHQHWHLGETLTWTPFKDLELLGLILSMNDDAILDQAIDAKVSKGIIERLHPRALKALSETKNLYSRNKLALLDD